MINSSAGHAGRHWYLLLFISLFALNQLHAISPGENPSEPDSLSFSPDSLSVLEQRGMSADDSLEFNREKLAQDVQEEVNRRINRAGINAIPHLIYRENYHLITPTIFNPDIKKNGFSIIPFSVQPVQYLQDFFTMNEISYRRNRLDFTSHSTFLPVSFTESFLCLGDYEMNHAGFLFHKGNIAGIENLGLKVGYLGDEGNWLGINEAGRNFDLELFYSRNRCKMHLFYNNISRMISPLKLYPVPDLTEDEKVRYRLQETSFLLENPVIDVGFRYEYCSLTTSNRDLYQFLLKKKILFPGNTLNLSAEYIYNSPAETRELYCNWDHELKTNLFHIASTGSYHKKGEFDISAEAGLRIYQNLHFWNEYTKVENNQAGIHYFLEKKSSGLFWRGERCEIRISGGINSEQNVEYFLENYSHIRIELGALNLLLNNYLIYSSPENDEFNYPEWQIKTDLSFNLDVRHGNSITLGLEQNYCSLFINPCCPDPFLFRNETFLLTAYLAVNITPLFRIRLDAVNLANTENIFGYDIHNRLPEIHFNVSVNWIFIN